jgi:toxin ParE1/3/4
MIVRLSRRADGDLGEIFLYTARRFGEEQAEEYYWDLCACFDLLADNPAAGRLRLEFTPPLRAHRHRHHIIFYEVLGDHILIVRVLHEKMDIRQHSLDP